MTPALCWGRNTDHLRSDRTTSAIVGRSAGSWSQQRIVMSHTESVKPSSCASTGRVGRSPLIIFEVITEAVDPSNGHLPVKTLDTDWISGEPSNTNARGPTSIKTIAKANTSASHVIVSFPSRTSGAAHAGVYAFSCAVEITPRAIEANSKSVKRARPL